MVIDMVLQAREDRRNKIKNLSLESDVVTVKANVPGTEKSLPQAILVVAHFIKEVQKIGAKLHSVDNGSDGVTAYFITQQGIKLKKEAERIEQTQDIGRLIDIDVTLKGEQKSLSRQNMRKCFLCDNPAFVCGRNRTHSQGELVKFFINSSDVYFSTIIEKVIEESMLAELDLENKFGLVTPTSNGSHSDLNYTVMKNAISAIKKPLGKAFFLSLTCNDEEGLMGKLIPIGLECEEKMLEVTFGANAYKGFIFIGGLLLASTALVIKNNGTKEEIFRKASEICKNFNFPNDTFGAKAFDAGFGGLRNEVKNGFLNVLGAEKFLQEHSLHQTLKFIVKNLDDSVLFKRAKSQEKYRYFKNLISNSINDGQVSKECIENGISIGGSADVLIACVMISKLEKLFYLRV